MPAWGVPVGASQTSRMISRLVGSPERFYWPRRGLESPGSTDRALVQLCRWTHPRTDAPRSENPADGSDASSALALLWRHPQFVVTEDFLLRVESGE